jgi:Mycothiol maleylpyruvate isomerase N-terminal domain
VASENLSRSWTWPPHTVAVVEAALNRTLLAEEERGWSELHALVDSLPRDRIEEPGYFAEGWSAKDLLGHIGSWLAEAAAVLERIHFGTYRRDEIDIDAMNEVFFKAMHDVPFPIVRAQGVAARSRMLAAWGALPGPSEDAEWWIRKAGPDHYQEHLPRLLEWAAELAASSSL